VAASAPATHVVVALDERREAQAHVVVQQRQQLRKHALLQQRQRARSLALLHLLRELAQQRGAEVGRQGRLVLLLRVVRVRGLRGALRLRLGQQRGQLDGQRACGAGRVAGLVGW
jgi:hypothetical protein